VAVEKLTHQEFAEIGSRQDALQTIFSGLLDIFYRPIFGFVENSRLLQHALAVQPAIGLGSDGLSPG
jgi:hypothetical protein